MCVELLKNFPPYLKCTRDIEQNVVYTINSNRGNLLRCKRIFSNNCFRCI